MVRIEVEICILAIVACIVGVVFARPTSTTLERVMISILALIQFVGTIRIVKEGVVSGVRNPKE